MKKINLQQAGNYTSPNPVSIICSRKPDGKTNLATVSWWNYMSFEPEVFGFVMGTQAYTGDLLKNTKEVILTIPGSSLAKIGMQCGSVSGRSHDKVKDFEIEMKSIDHTEIEIPKDTALALHGEVIEIIEITGNYLYVCKVKQVLADETTKPLFAWNGYSKLAPAKED